MRNYNAIPGLRDALRYLDLEYPKFLTHVLNMGSPEPDYSIQTAMVVLDPLSPGSFRFCVNPEFAETLSFEELAFVLSHETLHILLGHLIPHDRMPDLVKKNKAGDLIINDYLAHAGFPVSDDYLKGPNVIGMDCAQLELEDVYNMLPDDPEDEHSDHCGSVESSSQVSRQLAEAAQQAARGSAGQDLPDDLKDRVESATSALAGTGFASVQEYAAAQNISLKWMDLLIEVNPDILKKIGARGPDTVTSYHEPRRKVAHMYPEIILPNRRESEKSTNKKGTRKPLLVLALDTSGSIPRSTVDKMKSLAMSAPDDLIEVRACTFSTRHVPFDHKSETNRIASGGTDFSAVETFVRSLEYPNYPKAVVVITDGIAEFNYASPTPQQLQENWLWLITTEPQHYWKYYVDRLRQASPGRVHFLSEFTA